MRNIYKTDWLAFNPIFYNEKNNTVSSNINDVIDYRNLEFDADGLCNYLDYGYSVFGHTPIKYVKFLPPNSELSISGGKLSVIQKSDPVGKFIEGQSSEEEVMSLLERKIWGWEKKNKNRKIIIPTSGGYDSRLLNALIKDKKRIRSFTYGVSNDQKKSREVVYAKYISKQLKTQWNFIPLTHINDYLYKWYELYGVCTHFHGMYHYEFYERIHNLVSNAAVLSGVIGDAWSGNVVIPPVRSSKDVKHLGYSHGVGADSKYCKLKPYSDFAGEYFKKNKWGLKNSRYRIVESMRFKSILLSYLIKIPRSFGYETWSPFLDIDVATSMLKLPEDRKKSRLWQEEFFVKNKLSPENQNLTFDTRNTLDLESLWQVRMSPLDKKLLGHIIESDYVESINRDLDSFYKFGNLLKLAQSVIDMPSISTLYNKLGFKKDIYGTNSKMYDTYSAYMIIKPIEMLIRLSKK